MDAVADFFNRATGRTGPLPGGMPFSKVFSFGHIDKRIQSHLVRVYATLACCVAVAAAGVAASVSLGGAAVFGGALTALAGFAALLGVMWTAPTSANAGKRLGMLAAFAFCEGASMGPLVNLALEVSPSLLLVACAATATVFASFSAAALLTPRRSYLFLGAWLSSGVMAMLAARMFGWMLGLGRLAFELELVGGLLVFAGYVIFDTQVIVERCGAGDFDSIKHALDLFVDLAAVFVRVLVVLMRNAEKRRGGEEEDEGGRGRRGRRRD